MLQNLLFCALLQMLWPGDKTSCDKIGINPLLGDLSYYYRFGKLPGKSTNEDLRIKTHLLFVEEMLRKKESGHLTAELRKSRAQLLDRLHEYAVAEMYPSNYDSPNERKPCFIDKNGRICAVGYLIEKTSGRHLAEEINSRHHNDYILDMDDAALNAWIEKSGLNIEECAMIQPAYGPQTRGAEASEITSSVFLNGINLFTDALNIYGMARKKPKKVPAVTSVVSGLLTCGYGASVYYGYSDKIRVASPHTLLSEQIAFVNMCLGFGTLLCGSFSLLQRADLRAVQQGKRAPFTFAPQVFMTPDHLAAPGFTLLKRF
jgi:hypothetical protein